MRRGGVPRPPTCCCRNRPPAQPAMRLQRGPNRAASNVTGTMTGRRCNPSLPRILLRISSEHVMKAIVVKPGVKDSIHMRDMPDPKMRPDEVAVKMIRVGLCGTDAEINHGVYGKAPEGNEFLILGHENLGVVEDVGKKVKGWKPGDLVVATVRRPCGICPQCKAGENDMCSSGKYTVRGIMRRHGYMCEFYTEKPLFLNKIPKEIRDFAVL